MNLRTIIKKLGQKGMFIDISGKIQKQYWEGEYEGNACKIGIIDMSEKYGIPKIDSNIPISKQNLTKLKDFINNL